MLSEYRVLDCSDQLGWLAGRMLADLGADVFKVESPHADIASPDWQAYNVNKRLLRLDLQSPANRVTFEQLVERVDILLETALPGTPSARFFDYPKLKQINPRLIHVSVTAFGSDGPRAHWLASDIELMAAGGAMSLAGEPEETPMRISVPQSYAWAGAQAAVGALVALVHCNVTGIGQHVDVSAQAAVVTALSHAPAFVDMLGVVPTRCGAFITGRALSGARFRAFWPCADGYINFALYGGSAGRRSNQQLVAWMGEKGADLGILAGIDWERFDPKLLTQDQIDRMEAPIGRFLSSITKREFLDGASAREMLGYPVSTVADIAADSQLEARGFWQDMLMSDGTHQRHCGSFAMVDGKRATLRYPPGSEVSLENILRELGASESRANGDESCATTGAA